jgi:hypothetical protein
MKKGGTVFGKTHPRTGCLRGLDEDIILPDELNMVFLNLWRKFSQLLFFPLEETQKGEGSENEKIRLDVLGHRSLSRVFFRLRRNDEKRDKS